MVNPRSRNWEPPQEASPKSFIQQVKGALRFTESGIKEATANLTKEKANKYKVLLAAHKTAKKELDDWLGTKPVRNEENLEKFKNFREEIQNTLAQIESFK